MDTQPEREPDTSDTAANAEPLEDLEPTESDTETIVGGMTAVSNAPPPPKHHDPDKYGPFG
jgi:hypothetical protein